MMGGCTSANPRLHSGGYPAVESVWQGIPSL